MLLVPLPAPRIEPIPQGAGLAWNGSREAARAAFDALPFIMEADETEMLVVDPRRAATDAGEAGRRHRGSACPPRRPCHGQPKASAGRPIDDVIATSLPQAGADLLVLGAYGHSRLREFLFGGVTRRVLKAMPVATFMSR